MLQATVDFGALRLKLCWESNPTYAVYRHSNNRKWFALVMDIPKSRLGLREDGMIDVVNLKCDPVLIGSLRMENGIFPAYHMSKDKWISVALDGSVDDEQIVHFNSTADPAELSKMMFRHRTAPPAFSEANRFFEKCPVPIFIVSNIDTPDINEASPNALMNTVRYL